MSTGSSTRTALRARREQRRVRRGATLGMCCGAARRGPPSRALRPRRAAKRGAPRAALSAGTPTAHVGVSVWGLRRCISAPPVGPGGDGEQNGPFLGGGEGGEGEPRGGQRAAGGPSVRRCAPTRRGEAERRSPPRPGPARRCPLPAHLQLESRFEALRGGPGGGGRGERRCGAAGVGRRAEGGAAPRLRPGTPSIEVGERCGGGTGRGGCGWGGAGGTWGRWGSGAGGGMGRGTRVGAGMAALCAPEPPPPRPQRGAAIRGDGAEGAQCGGVS